MQLDLGPELSEWLARPEVKRAISELVRQAVREEVKRLLADELLDVKDAAQILQMSEGALRKAVERGQIPCLRLGRRLRFRRGELLQIAPVAETAAHR